MAKKSARFNFGKHKKAEVSNFDILDPLLGALLKTAGRLQLPLQRAHKNSGGGRSVKISLTYTFNCIDRI